MRIFPARYPDEQYLTKPLVFLAGPIQGADTWQKTAILRIEKLTKEVDIACPRRHLFRQEDPEIPFSVDQGEYAQYDWETYCLNRSAKNGVILFWLAKEYEHICSRAYGQTTRWELAEWKERARLGNAKIVVGIESGWTGERYMRRRFSQDLPNMRIHTTLGGTIKDAIAIVQGTPRE